MKDAVTRILRSNNAYGWAGFAAGAPGCLVLALNVSWSGWAWPAFLASNLAWITYAWRTRLWHQFFQQLVYTGVTLLGIFRWLL